MDQKLLFLINREWTNSTLDLCMAAITTFDVWLLPIVIAALAVAIRGRFKARVFLLLLGLLLALNDGGISRSLKRIVDRPRPGESVNDVRQLGLAKARPRFLALAKPVKVKLSRSVFADVDGRSFPSGHTMNMFTAATIATAFYPRIGWLGFIIASLVGYSRVYVGAHWPSDVATTAVLALGCTLLWLALAEWLWQRVGERWLPTLHARHPRLIAT